MMGRTNMFSLLPPQIIHQIIRFLLPNNPNAIIHPSHEATKTLLALTRVCRATYQLASSALRLHCVYLDSETQIQALLKCLSTAPVNSHGPIRSMFLHAFVDADGLPPRVPNHAYEEDEQTLDSMYKGLHCMEPVDWVDQVCVHDETAENVRDLLVAVAPTLRRLIFDYPACIVQEEVCGRLWPAFRAGLSSLTYLEEFVSTHYDVSHFDHDVESDACWPNLRRLALDCPEIDAENEIWKHMARFWRWLSWLMRIRLTIRQKETDEDSNDSTIMMTIASAGASYGSTANRFGLLARTSRRNGSMP